MSLAELNFTSEVVFVFCLFLELSSTRGTKTVLVNCLAKQLYMWCSLKHALTESHARPPEQVGAWRSYYFQLISHPPFVRARFKELLRWSCFILPRLAQNSSKQLLKLVEELCQMGPK